MLKTAANPQTDVSAPERNAYASFTCEGAFLKATAVGKWLKGPERGWKMVMPLLNG